jgi:hypothetical protein
MTGSSICTSLLSPNKLTCDEFYSLEFCAIANCFFRKGDSISIIIAHRVVPKKGIKPTGQSQAFQCFLLAAQINRLVKSKSICIFRLFNYSRDSTSANSFDGSHTKTYRVVIVYGKFIKDFTSGPNMSPIRLHSSIKKDTCLMSLIL